MIDDVKKEVFKLLSKDNTGHDMNHIERVLKMSLKFATNEKADKNIVSLIALLHDVDDYKLFDIENSDNLKNARNILELFKIEDNVKEQVLNGIKTIGYSKRLKCIEPKSIESKIVSDADMCDAMGTIGILRCYQYNITHGNLFFDRNLYPTLNMSANEYITKKDGTVVNHMFEKLLKLKDLMLTDSGKKEAKKRYDIMVEFLYHYFEEEDAMEWIDYLNNYLKKKY